MIKKLENIKIEFYCLNSPITTEKDPFLIENMLNAYFSSSFSINKKDYNTHIPEFNS